MMFSIPEAAHSSTEYWMRGLSTTGSISFGCAFVAGRNRVPSPAAGNTAFRTRFGFSGIARFRPAQTCNLRGPLSVVNPIEKNSADLWRQRIRAYLPRDLDSASPSPLAEHSNPSTKRYLFKIIVEDHDPCRRICPDFFVMLAKECAV